MESKKYIKIFSGLKRNFGSADLSKIQIDSTTGKAKPIYSWAHREITEQDYLDHLNGKQSIGIQPCDDQGMAQFGAIDIDDKQHSYTNFPYKKYIDIIAENNLPLIPVRSKSGGMHLYLFLKEPIRAVAIRNFLEGLLFTLKLPTNIEIYPKQTELGQDAEGKYIHGQFINLPYYNKTERKAFNLDGTFFTFEQFIKVVEANTLTADELEEFTLEHTKKILVGGGEEFNDGPPCLAILTKDKLSDGRDRFLYNYMVFAKKKYPDNWEEMVKAAPIKYFKADSNGIIDWTEEKTKKKINSWKKESTKGHTCNEDPIQPVCMKAECRKRTFGYLSDKKKVFPALSGLQKITYPEPQYTFNVTLADGQTTKEVRAQNIKQIIEQENKAVIWAHYRHDINAIVEAVEKNFGKGSYVTYYGDTSNEDRQDAIKQIQDPNSPVRFIIGTPQTGGYGITLTGANVMIYYANGYDYKKRIQSEARINRAGQTRKMTYIDIIAEDTVDEKIVKALRGKMNIASKITGDELKDWI